MGLLGTSKKEGTTQVARGRGDQPGSKRRVTAILGSPIAVSRNNSKKKSATLRGGLGKLREVSIMANSSDVEL